MNEHEQQAVIAICVLAALSDGAQSEAERAQVERVAQLFQQNPALGSVAKDAVEQKLTLSDLAQSLQRSESRGLAYEMAVGVCHADGPLTEDETRFLQQLRSALELAPETAAQTETQAAQLMQIPPVIAAPAVSPTDHELDEMILNNSILTGALELLPHSLATMAIIPIQIRMVYRVGQRYGFELGRGHIQDFLGTVGVGLTSHMMDGFARKLVGGLTRTVAGRFLGGLAEAATGSALAFGTTYALGQVAKRYYSGGRRLDAAQLREVFSSLLNEGQALQQRYSSQIAQKSRQINLSDLLPLVRQT